MSSRDLIEKAKAIKLLILDVDGVLTDGSLYFGPDGEAFKKFHVRDGVGIRRAKDAGLDVLFATGKHTRMVELRANQLGIYSFEVAPFDKLPGIKAIMENYHFAPSEVAYMGDDLPDIPVKDAVGLSFCPNDAAAGVPAAADVMVPIPGGRGAVRAAIDDLLAMRESAD